VKLVVAIAVVLIAATAHAQPAASPIDVQLEIDDCPKPDEGLTQQQLLTRGGERFERGNTLYLQGDYAGSVKELVGAYCTIPFPSILKNIGQSYERLLEYEKAIGYLQRYADAITPETKRESDCAVEPMVDKQNTLRRIEVLKRLDAHVLVETTPDEATITLMSAERRVAWGKSGKREELLVPGGKYEMIVEKVGHQTVRKSIEVKIGKPYTFYIPLDRLKGTLSIQTTPADARVFIDKRFVGVGRALETMPATQYHILVEAGGHLDYDKTIEVLPDQETRLNIQLEPRPQFARRQLIVFSGITGSIATGQMLYAFEDTLVASVGGAAGVAAGLLGSYLYLPEEVPLGTANLTITTSLAAGAVGLGTTLLFTERQGTVNPIVGASLVLGAGGGYYFGNRTKISPGDAALLNSTMVWGGVSGAGFAVSFGAGRQLSSGLVLSGLGMGTIGGLVMTRYYEISRTHAALIDVGGVIGMIGGFAAVGLAYRDDENAQRNDEHTANFALGGMAIGLIAAGIFTRNFDAPKIPVTPTLGTVQDTTGTSSMTIGLGGNW
jgi:hypothetical protein